VKKENKAAPQWALIRMTRYTRCVSVTDKFSCSKLRNRLGTDYVITALQQNGLKWCGNVLRKDENDSATQCMDYEVENARSGGRQQTT